MKAIGIVILYERSLGAPVDISKKNSEYFPSITENLVKEGLINLPDLREIIDMKRIYWGGIKENFDQIIIDDEAIGKLAWHVYNSNSGSEPSEEVKSLVYDGSKAPWSFTLMACVIYE